MKKLLTRYRNWTITGHLCRKYGYVPDDVRPLVDSMGEFGAELTLYVAKRFNLGLGDAREQAINAMVHLSRSLVEDRGDGGGGPSEASRESRPRRKERT